VTEVLDAVRLLRQRVDQNSCRLKCNFLFLLNYEQVAENRSLNLSLMKIHFSIPWVNYMNINKSFQVEISAKIGPNINILALL